MFTILLVFAVIIIRRDVTKTSHVNHILIALPTHLLLSFMVVHSFRKALSTASYSS